MNKKVKHLLHWKVIKQYFGNS